MDNNTKPKQSSIFDAIPEFEVEGIKPIAAKTEQAIEEPISFEADSLDLHIEVEFIESVIIRHDAPIFDIAFDPIELPIKMPIAEIEAVPVQQSTAKMKKVEKIDLQIKPVEDIKGFSLYKIKAQAQIQLCKKIELVLDEDANTLAREVAKQADTLAKEVNKFKIDLNKPLDEQKKVNGELASEIITPLENETNRLKALINSFETEKEKRRQAEIKRLEEERKKKEEEERLEAERVRSIKQNISKIENEYGTYIQNAKTVQQLILAIQKLGDWQPKQAVFQEYYQNVKDIVKQLIEKAQSRIPTIQELENLAKERERLAAEALRQKKQQEEELAIIQEEKTKLEGEALKLKQEQEAALKKQQEEKAKADELAMLQKQKEQDDLKKQQDEMALIKQKQEDMAKDHKEMVAKQELIVLLSSMEIKNIPVKVEQIIADYGSAADSMEKREDMIAKYFQNKEVEKIEKQLKAGIMKNQRVDLSFEILDETLIPREFLKVDEMAIKKALIEHRAELVKSLDSFTIAGIKISKSSSTILK